MYFSGVIFFALALATVQACQKCTHPGDFQGKLGWLRNTTASYCGTSGTPSNSIYASVDVEFFDPPDESPCGAAINVTNPTTRKTIQAIVVDKCDDCLDDAILLTLNGLRALSPNGRVVRAPRNVSWTFA
ncbi:hypothetical protein JMJ35_009257 [Cladonia borealis]|uniref:RlpA-like protein double-psi beta-barrel domain-containing protein n=1 Tax=Cladonia borealis TaxID=184061 RepID=A0AA39QS61_9LECA|nr:hypothetical protein JMJ35_009257 [Cladonia borealis]